MIGTLKKQHRYKNAKIKAANSRNDKVYRKRKMYASMDEVLENDHIGKVVTSNNNPRPFSPQELQNDIVDWNDRSMHNKFRDLTFLKMNDKHTRNKSGVFLQTEQIKNSLVSQYLKKSQLMMSSNGVEDSSVNIQVRSNNLA